MGQSFATHNAAMQEEEEELITSATEVERVVEEIHSFIHCVAAYTPPRQVRVSSKEEYEWGCICNICVTMLYRFHSCVSFFHPMKLH